VSELKNPFDSLNNYFDDLLGIDNTSEDALLPHVAQLPHTATQPLTESITPPVTSPVTSKVPAQKPKKTHQHKVAVKTKTQTRDNLPFAEPAQDQKEKLQKLLLNVQPKLNTKTQPKPTFVADPHEIQDWPVDIATPVITPIDAPASVQLETVALTGVTPITEAQEEHSIEHKHYQIPSLEWMPNGLPQWAQARFDVLLFKVSGLLLAVPLISLGQIQPITDELTPLFGQADWFMGLQPTNQGKIRTVNTAKFVMPERYDENFVKNAKYVVSINGVPWGLAVDSVNQPITLLPEDVKWRTDRSKRPWLAGTVKEHMCALLDIPMIGQILLDADKNFTEPPKHSYT
jgi:purine-binding chemotaxis protein CheW